MSRVQRPLLKCCGEQTRIAVIIKWVDATHRRHGSQRLSHLRYTDRQRRDGWSICSWIADANDIKFLIIDRIDSYKVALSGVRIVVIDALRRVRTRCRIRAQLTKRRDVNGAARK